MNPIVSGVSFPSYADEGFQADYPATSLSDLVNIRRVAVRSNANAFSVDFVLPEDRVVDFVAVVHHNAGPTTTVTIQLSSGAAPGSNVVYNSGPQPMVPDGGLFKSVFPHRIPQSETIRSGRLSFSANPEPMEIGAVEIGRFWSWTDVSVPREIGIDSTAQVFDAGGGVEHVTRQWSPRIVRGQRQVVDQEELDTTLLDFHRTNGLWRPFVWCWDATNPDTWAREAVLVTNSEVSPGVASEVRSGQMAFAFQEHLL